MKPLIPDRKIEMQNLLIAKKRNKTLFFGKIRKDGFIYTCEKIYFFR